MSTNLIGKPVSRVDGRRKVTGRAEYAAEMLLPNMTHAVLVGSTVASGRIERLDVAAAERAPGVLLVLTHGNRGPLGKMPSGADGSGMTAEPRPPLEDDLIHYYGQYVAMVVAETAEQAHHAASLVKVQYQLAPFVVAIDDPRAARYQPGPVMGQKLQVHRGDVHGALVNAAVRGGERGSKHGDCPGALDEAEVCIDQWYTSPTEHPTAMEPHATVAAWANGELTVYNASQWIVGDRAVLAAGLKLPPEKIRVLAPFVGGMFGSKVCTAPHTLLAAVASIRLGRPVKAVLTRQQVFTNVGHRTETAQRFTLGASTDGTLMAMRHATITHSPVVNGHPDDNENIESTSFTSRLLYACPNYESTHEAVRLNVMKPGWMRAPGEAPCTWALESAMDELAVALKMDPIELRRRNHADVHPANGKPFSSKHLLACYERGAERFGWARRTPAPGSMRDGETLIGWGMATATYAAYLIGATARVRFESAGGGVLATVSTAGTDVGQGLYTVMAIVAAEGLALPIDRVKVELGDTNLPRCAPAGGSSLTASLAPAITDACSELRGKLLALAALADNGFPDAAEHPEDFVFHDGAISHKANGARTIPYAELLALADGGAVEAEASTQMLMAENDQFAFQEFGAQFVEVRVNPDIGQVRVSRVVSVFDIGRVINAKGTRSQLIGGIVFGIGQALLEALYYDPAHGQPINNDLAGYPVPVHADVPAIDVSWLDEPDFNFNAIGCRGAGEIGITGVAAAIANAVYHATGKRVRDLPISPERFV